MNRCQGLINQQEEGVSFVGESWPQKKGPKCQTFCLEVMLEKTFQSFYMLMKHQFFYWLWHTTVDLYWKLVMWLWQQLNVKAYRQIESWAKVTHKLLKKNTAKYCGEKTSNCLETFDKILEKQQKLRVRIILVRKEGFPGKPFFFLDQEIWEKFAQVVRIIAFHLAKYKTVSFSVRDDKRSFTSPFS